MIIQNFNLFLFLDWEGNGRSNRNWKFIESSNQVPSAIFFNEKLAATVAFAIAVVKSVVGIGEGGGVRVVTGWFQANDRR